MSKALIVEAQESVGADPQRVFDILADPTLWSALDTALVEVTPRDRLVPGANGTIRRRVGLGMAVTTRWMNTSFVPGAHIENLITGFGYELRETIDLAPDEHGTAVVVVNTLTPTSLIGRAMVAMSRGTIEGSLRARFVALKALVESEARPATAS